jgi:Carboxypeptidase regulatory-like domain
MMRTRRGWISGLLCGISCARWQPPTKGDVAAGKICSGRVSDLTGKGIPGVVVVIMADGRVATGASDKNGVYELRAPEKGPYTILFKEPQGHTLAHSVDLLTPSTDQSLSVSTDLEQNTVLARYNAVRAVEALLWLSRDSTGQMRHLRQSVFTSGELDATLTKAVKGLNGLKGKVDDEQYNLLWKKYAMVSQQLQDTVS